MEISHGGVDCDQRGQRAFLNVAVANGSTVDTDQLSSLDLRGTTTIDGTVTFEGQGPLSFTTRPRLSADRARRTRQLRQITGAGNIGSGDQSFGLVNEQSSIINASGSQTLIIDNDSPELRVRRPAMPSSTRE